jgi:exonuclease III
MLSMTSMTASCATGRQNIKHSLPNILLFNARSHFNKIDELIIIINQQNADVSMVTETWLTDAIPDEALHIPDFTIVWKDRPTRTGGGVAVFIRESLSFKIRPDFNN